jgi:hypothetical protein
MRQPMTRRRILRGAAGGVLLLPSTRAALAYAANDRLRLAVVGMAGFGAWHGFAELIHAYGYCQYAIGCDVDRRKVRKVRDLWEKRAAEWAASGTPDQKKAAAEFYAPLAASPPPLVADFRRLFDDRAGDFDAVVVATPDHTHAVIASAALRAGKPVLCEKPLTISAHEARALHRLARERKLPTQMNNHGASRPGFRRGVEILREGLLGEVREVHVFFSRGGQNFQAPPQGAQEVPPELDWDLWLAQLQERPYHPGWINRIAWRESSLGELGNFGPHAASLAFLSLRVADLWVDGAGGARIRVVSECSEANPLSYPRWERIRWEVPARGPLPPVAITWHHGHPPDYAEGSRKRLEAILRDHGAADGDLARLLPPAGCLILGSKGLLATPSHNTEVELLPKARFADVEQKRPLALPVPRTHYAEWIDACRGGAQAPYCRFEHAAPFAEFLCVGSLSTRFPGEPIDFDPADGRITNHPRAAEHLQYAYRKGWTL